MSYLAFKSLKNTNKAHLLILLIVILRYKLAYAYSRTYHYELTGIRH